MADAKKIELGTTDGTTNNIELIAELFPQVITEVEGADGELRRAIDFDALRELLGDVAEGGRERYQFTWPGKREAKAEARRPITKTMIPCPEKSKDWDTTENLYIEGDNLDALKILKETYAGKVKFVYIDPPYNTGDDRLYVDSYSQTREEYKETVGDYDEHGGRLVANTESNGRFHSVWCSIMYPRLLVARDLLTADGLIFISIDDNELANLNKLANEVFGSSNFVANFIWEKRKTRENRKAVSVRHDYVVAYCKDRLQLGAALGLEPMDDEALKRYKNPDNDPRGPWTSVPAIAQGGHGTSSQFYTFVSPAGISFDPPSGSCWRMTLPKMQKAIADNRIWFGQDGTNVPRIKKFLNEGKQGLTPETLLHADKVGTNDTAKRELVALFDGEAVFETPKPVSLLKHLIGLVEGGKEALYVDFYSGSASFAEAVMSLNAADKGKRRWILIQIPESVEENTVAYRVGYENLCAVGEERIRRAGAKIAAEIDEANKQLELGAEPKPYPDLGFRVLRIDSSNFKDSYLMPSETDQASLLDLVDNVKEGRGELDLLFEVLPKFRIPYSAQIEEFELGGRRCFNVNGGQLVACFDDEVGVETIEEMAKMAPDYAVMRDASMADDATQANFEELFRTYSPDTVRRVI